MKKFFILILILIFFTNQVVFAAGLTVNSGATLTLADGVQYDIDGDVTVNGTLNMGTSTVNLTGNWDATGGTFTAATSQVFFKGTGNQNVTSAGNPFNDVVVTNTDGAVYFLDGFTTENFTDTSGGGELYFANGETYTITVALTLDGGIGNLILLDTDDGSPANFIVDVGVATDVGFLNVNHADASGFNITCTSCTDGTTNNSDDLNGTDDWLFSGSAEAVDAALKNVCDYFY